MFVKLAVEYGCCRLVRLLLCHLGDALLGAQPLGAVGTSTAAGGPAHTVLLDISTAGGHHSLLQLLCLTSACSCLNCE